MNRTQLNKATSADTSPTPGYMFDEIAKVTHDPVGNERLVEYLVKRLESTSSDVKAKVLTIVKHVCRKGDPAFRRAWQREAAAVKAHLQYHTAPDALRGDEPSRRVREAAKAALEAVFDASRDERRTANDLQGRIQGFGMAPPNSSDHQSSSYHQNASSHPDVRASPSPSSSGRYGVIGNPNFQDPRNQPKSMLERMAEKVKEKWEEQKNDAPNNWMNQQDLPGGYSLATNRGANPYSAHQGSYDPTLAQRVPDPRSPRPISSSSSPAPPSSSSMPTATSTITSHRARSSTGSTNQESSLIQELCAPGGVRPMPPSDKLEAFVRACKTSLDPENVVRFLNEKLVSEDWKVQHKALCVMEALLRQGNTNEGLQIFGDKFDENPQHLELLYNAKNPTLRDRAQKVWKLLYEDDNDNNNNDMVVSNNNSNNRDMNKGSVSQLKSPTTGNDEINLLDFEESSPPPPTTTSNNNNNNNTGGMTNMFQNMSVKKESTPVTTSSSSSGFSFLDGASNAQAQKQAPIQSQEASNNKPKAAQILDLFSTPSSQLQQQQAPVQYNYNNNPVGNNMGMMMPQQQQAPMMMMPQQPPPPMMQIPVQQPIVTSMQPSNHSITPKKTQQSQKNDSFSFVQDALQGTKNGA